MGCDIHAVIETHNGDVRCDNTVADIHFDRNYYLFGVLAGVRHSEVPHIDPRGRLPSGRGSTWKTERMYDDYADHSYSWLWTEEFEAALKVYSECAWPDEDDTARNVPPMCIAVLHMMKALEAGGVRARLVFGFDS